MGGALRRVEGPRGLAGALRWEHGARVAGPSPTTAIVATARLPDGSWRFATEDGTVLGAGAFQGPLSVVRGLPFPLLRATGALPRSLHSLGVLAVVDQDLHGWRVDPQGQPRSLGLERVLSLCFVTAARGLAVVEPGVLKVTTDGEHFASEVFPDPPAAYGWVADGVARVRGLRSTWRWTDGGFLPDNDAPSPEVWFGSLPSAPRELWAPLPWGAPGLEPEVEVRGSRFAVEGGALVERDALRGVERSRAPLPGEDCRIHRAGDSVAAVCRHEGWATFVARRGRRGAWTVLRDEARAEPLGAVVFDRQGPSWVVRAPCVQGPSQRPRALCLHGPDGRPQELEPPRAMVPLDLQGDVLVGAEESPGATPRLFLVSPRGLLEVPLPAAARGPVQARWTGLDLTVLHHLTGGGLALAVARQEGDRVRVRPEALPEGTSDALLADDGVLAWGRDASSLAWRAHGGAFIAVPLPLRGAATTLALDPSEGARCVGAWCVVGGALWRGPAAPTAALARQDPPPARHADGPAPRSLRCDHGASRTAPEIDRGAAASGYAVRSTLRGGTLTVRWSGENAQGTLTADRVRSPTTHAYTWGVLGAPSPAALVEWCEGLSCEALLATPRGLTELGLGPRPPGAASLHVGVNGAWLGRADEALAGATLVTVARVGGAVGARGVFALAAGPEDAWVGSLDGADGLWVRARDQGLRFYPLQGGASPPELRPSLDERRVCPPGFAARGSFRRTRSLAAVRGPGWAVVGDEWRSEEVYAVDERTACLLAAMGGEARDEPEGVHEVVEPVRSFLVEAAAGGVLAGLAWQGERAHALRCRWE